jgi:hypothetical protein
MLHLGVANGESLVFELPSKEGPRNFLGDFEIRKIIKQLLTQLHVNINTNSKK